MKRAFSFEQLRWLALYRHKKNKPAFVAILDVRYHWYLFLQVLKKELEKDLARLGF